MEAWEMSFNGRTWRDMPGACGENKKLNFALFRRGKLHLTEAQMEVEMSDGGMEVVTVLESPICRSGMRTRGLAGRAREQAVRWAKSPGLTKAAAAGAGRRVRQIDDRQRGLVARYKALAAAINRGDKPRALLVAAVRAQGMPEGALLNGLEKGMRWTEERMAVVERGLDALEDHLMRSRALREEVAGLLEVYWRECKGPTRMPDLCRESKISEQTVKDFRLGRLCLYTSMERMRDALRRLLARRGKETA